MIRKSTIKNALQSLFVVGIVSLIVASCSDINTSTPENGKARMNVHLTDAPADYQEVNINVQGVSIYHAPADLDTVDADSEEDGEWIDLSFEPMTINLLELQNGVDTLLASADLDPGYYGELRLMLGEGNNVMIDSTTHNLKVPSGQQSGYKVKFNTELEAGEDLDVTIDFDASRSVHKAGNSGKYILKPVLKAYVSDGEEMETGSIGGIVEPVEAEPYVIAMMEEDTVATAQPDTTGGFLLEGIEAGNYDLVIEAQNEAYQDTTINGISVEADEMTDIGTLTLEQSQ